MLRNRHYFFEVQQNLEIIDKYNLTMEKMKDGVPIIYQGLLLILMKNCMVILI